MGGVRATVQTLHAVQKVQVLALLLLLAICSPLGNVSCAPVDEPKNQDDSYVPREIAPGEGFLYETPPPVPSSELSPPWLLPTSESAFSQAYKTPQELSNFEPLASEVQDSEDQASDDQTYYNYQLAVNQEDQDDQVDQEDTTGIDLNLRPPSDTNMPDSNWPLSYEPLMKLYFGPKSKFFYDKDQVGIPGKANRFRREAVEGTGYAGSYSQSGASSSSGPNFFSNQAFPTFDSRFDQGFSAVGAGLGAAGLTGFDSYGGGSLYDAAGFGGYPQDQGQGYGGGSAQGGGGGGGGADSYGAGLGYGGGVPEYSHPTYGTDGFGNDNGERVGVQTRLGGDEVSGVGARISISGQGQGQGQARGVFSAASSSIDGNGKTTHTLSAGEIKK